MNHGRISSFGGEEKSRVQKCHTMGRQSVWGRYVVSASSETFFLKKAIVKDEVKRKDLKTI